MEVVVTDVAVVIDRVSPTVRISTLSESGLYLKTRPKAKPATRKILIIIRILCVLLIFKLVSVIFEAALSKRSNKKGARKSKIIESA